MASLSQSYDVSDLPKGTGDFQPLPPGWYSATITGAEIKSTKAGNGEYIAVKYSITGPTHQGRIIFSNLNIKNPNPKAEEIGRQQLGDVMRSIGLARVDDTDQLIGGSLVLKIEVKEDEKYGAGNEVKGFKAVAGGSMPSPGLTMPVLAAPVTGKAAPPWAKK
jgi:hypothetical protein